VVAVDWVDHQECPRDVPEFMAREEACFEGGSSIPETQIISATAINDLLAGKQVVGTFFPGVVDAVGLLGVTVAGITDGE